mmetsp:Transcript_35508/g.93182  ORF Transcript_35508/g.93182 Transcript_35508/m.93182 type:complete len:115 (+) Transcript_35508:219-563(+)
MNASAGHSAGRGARDNQSWIGRSRHWRPGELRGVHGMSGSVDLLATRARLEETQGCMRDLHSPAGRRTCWVAVVCGRIHALSGLSTRTMPHSSPPSNSNKEANSTGAGSRRFRC